MQSKLMRVLFLMLSFGIAGCGGGNPGSTDSGGGATSGPEEHFPMPVGETLMTVPIHEADSPMPGMHGVMAQPDSTANLYLLEPAESNSVLQIEQRTSSFESSAEHLAGGSAFSFYGGELRNAVAVFDMGDISDFVPVECNLDETECKVLPMGLTGEDDVHVLVSPNKHYIALFRR